MSDMAAEEPAWATQARTAGDAVQQRVLTRAVRMLTQESHLAPRAWDDLERMVAHGAAAWAVLDAPPAGDALAALFRLSALSRYAADVVARDPQMLHDALRDRRWTRVLGRARMAGELAQRIADATERSARAVALSHFRDAQQVRIILGDALRGLSFEHIISELSDLADVLIGSALALAEAATPSAGTLCVLALGKLGGRELNYSSDIDLMLVCSDDADHDAMTRIGQELIRVLERPAHGVMFRVDMRLRPEGERGALVLTRRECIDYYWSVGRPWERQALIKARACAGDLAMGRRLLAELTPWIYPEEPLWESLDEARVMRRRIDERAHSANLKTAAGGIRDIEFLCQYFQLLYGGRDAVLRDGATLPTLRRLRERGIVPRADADELEHHYIALRTVEHRLQMWEDRQVHELPADPVARAALAQRCGQTLDVFDRSMAHIRERVRLLAQRHFLDDSGNHDAWLQLVVQGEAAPERLAAMLSAHGLRQIPQAVTHLRALAHEPFFLLTRDRTERAVVRLAPQLLARVATCPDPDRALANLTRIADGVGGRATFFESLLESPATLELWVELAGWSGFLVELLAETPGLADELSAVLARGAPRASTLAGEVRGLLAGLSDAADTLRFIKGREQLAAAVHDIHQQQSPEAHLTATARVIAETALHRALGEVARAWGVPVEAGRPTRFALLAAGKAGGGELGYVSDLDVLFVCDPGGVCPRADRDGDAFWQRVAQTMTRALNGIYEIDARLRPWGEQGPLVTSTAALTAYWAEDRELWERMAMVRTVLFAGDRILGDEVVGVLRERAIAAPVPSDAVEQVRSMRSRLERSVAGHDNLKRGPGGYVDIEFIAQFFVLGCAAQDLPPRLSTASVLRWLAQRGRIPEQAAQTLLADLALLRRIENRLRLCLGVGSASHVPTDPAQRTLLARACGYADWAACASVIDAARQRARQWFDALLQS